MNVIKFGILFSFMICGSASAQITLSETMDMVNYRFADSQSRAYVDQHPSLTFNGFKSSNDDYGYSIESIINKIYFSSNPDDLILIGNLFEDIVDDTNLQEVINPSSSGNCPYNRSFVERNSRILQNLSLVALISYVATEEGINVQNPPNGVPSLPDPTQAISDLKAAFTRLLGYEVFGMTCGDEVHRQRSIMNTAKAVDLYLALENAYKHYESISNWNYTSSLFLDSTQKNNLMGYFKEVADGMFKHLRDGTLEWRTDNVEPGNRPLIIYSSIAYASLVMQGVDVIGELPDITTIDTLIEIALEKANGPAGNDRELYWGYQTSDGESFWAEGQYYFKLALKNVLSLWHAKRINNISTNFTYVDPYLSSNSMAKKPLLWLAQTYEPGGFSAPIDDGNKQEIRTSSILRWSSNYGNQEIGQRFSNIATEINTPNNGVGLNANLRVFELAIPRTLTSLSPDNKWGNPSSTFHSQNEHHEIVFRYTDNSNRKHFIYLNGEYGDAVVRGEGHEQPDQLQLLYSVDEHSYILDSGYDSAEGSGGLGDLITGDDFNRSTWNNYRDHNVLTAYHYSVHDINNVLPNPEAGYLGGLEYPERSGAIPRVQSDHNSVNTLYYDDNSPLKLDVASGSLYLTGINIAAETANDYVGVKRDVLFVKDDNEPYLIDISMGFTNKWLEPAFFMNMYHGNSGRLIYNLENSDHALWTEIDGESDKHLYLYTDNVEGNTVTNTPANATFYTDNVMEKFGEGQKNIERLNIYSQSIRNGTLFDYSSTNVSFIKPKIGMSETFLISNLPDLPTRKFTSDVQKKEQVYTWDINSFTKDVLITRSAAKYANAFSYTPSDINTTVEGINFTLPADKDFGFLRLIKTNGVWLPDSDFIYNIEDDNTYFVGGGNITSNTVFTGDIYIMADEDNLAIGAEVTFAFGSTVYFMGEQPKINTYGSGKIIANYVNFKGVSTSSEGVLISSSNNQITNSTFEGHTIGLKINSGSGNIIEGNTFKDNSRGLQTNIGTDVTLTNNKFIDNNYGIFSYGYLYLHADEQPGVYVYPNEFINNGIGIRSSINAQTHSYRSRFVGNNDNVRLNGSSTFYPGFSNTGNAFHSTNDKHIHNSTSNFVNADYQYWNNGGYPNSNQFYGFVSYSNRLTSDPTLITYDDECDDSGAFICQDPGPGVALRASVTTGELNNNSSKKEGKSQRQSTNVVSRLDEFYGSLRSSEKRDDYVSNAAIINEILSRYAFDDSQRQWSIFETVLSKYLAANILDSSQRSTLNNGQDEREVVSLEQNKLLVSLYLNTLIAQEKYQDLIKYHDRKLSELEYLQGDIQILSYKLQAFIMSGQYDKANALIHTYNFFADPDEDRSNSNNAKISTASNQEFIEFQRSLVLLNGKEFGEVTVNQNTNDTDSDTIVEDFTLDSAYPNPFNPSTVIPFSLKEQGNVKVSVYDIMGREVNVIADRVFSSGQHRVTFDANGLSSGIYLIRVWHNGQAFTKRVTLLK